MARLRFFLLLLSAAFVSTSAWAQVGAASSRPLSLLVYATGSGAAPELDRGTTFGGGGGFILEHNRFLALDFRGVLTFAAQPLHTAIAEAGPRVAPVYGRFHPYAEVLGGLGHTEYGTASHPPEGKGFGLTYTVAVGLDLPLKHGFAWRVAEYSYNHIEAGTGVSPQIISSGAVYRF